MLDHAGPHLSHTYSADYTYDTYYTSHTLST